MSRESGGLKSRKSKLYASLLLFSMRVPLIFLFDNSLLPSGSRPIASCARFSRGHVAVRAMCVLGGRLEDGVVCRWRSRNASLLN